MKKLTVCDFPLVQAVVAACVFAGCQTAPGPDAPVQVSQTRVCVAAAEVVLGSPQHEEEIKQ